MLIAPERKKRTDLYGTGRATGGNMWPGATNTQTGGVPTPPVIQPGQDGPTGSVRVTESGPMAGDFDAFTRVPAPTFPTGGMAGGNMGQTGSAQSGWMNMSIQQNPADTLGGTTQPPVVRNDWPTAPAAPEGTNTDLWGGISQLYQQYLGRTPNAQEISGHMPNPGGLQGVLDTIKNSPEYAQQQGTTTGSPFDAADPWHWFKQFTVGKGLPANSQTLQELAPTLQQYGIQVLKNAEGVYGKIKLPDGQIIDVIRAAGAGGGGPENWQWDTGAGASGGAGGGTGGDVGNWAGLPWSDLPDAYNDQYTQSMEQLIKERINQLLQAEENPYVNQYGDLLQGRVDELGQNSPEVQSLIDALNSRVGNLGKDDAYIQELLKRDYDLRAGTPEYQKLVDFANQRATNLAGPEYTGAQQEIFRTQALDPIERDRTAARERVLSDLSARGIDMHSGIAQAAMNQSDRNFDAMRAGAQGNIAASQAASYQSRQKEAQDALQQIYDLSEGRAGNAIDVTKSLDDYLNQREQEALQLRGTVADIGEGRANQQVDYGNQLASLSDLVRQQQDNRANQALALSGSLADLGPQRLQAALAALGQGESPSGVFNNLAALMGLQQGQQTLGLQNSAGNASGLGSLLGYLTQGGSAQGGGYQSGGLDLSSLLDAFAGVR